MNRREEGNSLGHSLRRSGYRRPARIRADAAFGLTAAFILTVLIGLPAAGAASGPTDTIRTTADTVLGILKDDTLKRPDRLDERLRRIEAAVRESVDYREMAKRALVTEWRHLTAQEQEEFSELFAELLRDAMASRLNEYSDESVEFLGERVEGTYAEVQTKLKGSKVNIPVSYRLTSQNGAWRVYDIVAEGISIIGNYRAQFTQIIRSSSYAVLVDKLRKKVSEPKPYQLVTSASK